MNMRRFILSMGAIIALSAAQLLGAGPAMACHEGDDAAACESHTPSGILIPALKHEQVGPMDTYYNDVMHLANQMASSKAYAADPRIAELQDVMTWTRWETVWAMGRIVPGSLTNEALITHKPSHASLAGAREALARMYAIAGRTDPAIANLHSEVNTAMVLNGGDLYGCAFSAMNFTTAEMAGPDIPLRTGAAFLGGTIVLLAFANIRHLLRRHTKAGPVTA